jgi:hypothetical protein
VCVDFESGVYESSIVHSSEIFLDDPTPSPISLCGKLPDVSSRPIFLALCLEFLQETNGRMSHVTDRCYNAMAIVKVDGSADDHLPDAQAVDRKPRPNPRHTPIRRPSINRAPIPRPLTPLEFPVPLRSIIADVLESPNILDRLLANATTSTEMTPKARAALGLFRLSSHYLPADAPAARIHGSKVRDGP